MPGKKDFVSVRIEGTRVYTCSKMTGLREVCHEFKETFPARKIGFSKFAELQPKHCILAGASGSHAVYVCTIQIDDA